MRSCSFFDGLPEEKYPNILSCLRAEQRSFRRDSSILNIGERSRLAGVVLRGTVALSFLDENGGQVNVAHVTQGETFGLSTACSRDEGSPVRLLALRDCDILFLDFHSLLTMDAPPCPFRAKVTTNLLHDIAAQNTFLNQRLRVLGQKRLRDKIKVYLQGCRMSGARVVRLPFNRSAWAEYLYADRSALSRELGRMSAEGILAVSGREIRILDPDFLQ